MVMCKKKTTISICARTLVLVLAVIITYCIGMKLYQKPKNDEKTICMINIDEKNKVVISFKENANKIDYYARWSCIEFCTNIEIECYDNITIIDECNKENIIFVSDDFLKALEFDVVYEGIRRHYSISDLKNNN